MKKIKYIIIIFILLCSFILLTISSYANTISKSLSNNFLRLHILANSDSKKDQDLKLKVRDNILEYMNTLTFENISKNDAISIVQKNINNFQNIAEKTIKEEGYSYPIKIELGNFYFPTKIYGNISLPAGFYDALKIEIGEAVGQNWWCSLFPPLCFVDISSGVIDEESTEELKENLSEEEFSIITNDSETIKLKFKLIEIFSK